jgi:TPR repeat protein
MKDSHSPLEGEAFAALQRNDGAHALKLFKKRAELGSDIACLIIGNIYFHGQGGIESSPSAAKPWYEKALNSRIKEVCQRAAMKLGYMYQGGFGVEIDNQKAFAYYKQLEGSDIPQGLTLLGVMYDYGTGIKKDEKKAMKLYCRAAKLGHVFGLKNLGILKVKRGNPLGFILWFAAIVIGLTIGIISPDSYRIKIT